MAMGHRGLEELWLRGLLFVLFGYALLGKGFAYLFLGEIVLLLGFIIFLTSRRVMLIFNDPVLLLWGLFAFWGLCRTVPFLSQYHFDAIRDAVVWAYGIVALMIVAFVNSSNQISRALNRYRKFLNWFLLIAPVLLIMSMTLGPSLPKIPWSTGTSILRLKAGDEGVNIAAAGLFLLIFPDRAREAGKHDVSIYRILGYSGIWVTVIVIAVINRGGLLSIALAILLAVALGGGRKLRWKIMAIGIIGGTVTLVALSVSPSIHVGKRTFSGDNLLAIVGSIAGGPAAGTGHEGTIEWRLAWWKNIVRETFFGPFFWTGRGFGVNLAIADGPFGRVASEDEVALRSPHNGSMTVLARMGVPGFVIWLAINAAFAVRMFNAQRRAVRAGSRFWSSFDLWILACWLATFTNLNFDVYLEGPQGGIWYWSIIGFGVAALRVQAYEARRFLAHPKAPEAQNAGEFLIPAS